MRFFFVVASLLLCVGSGVAVAADHSLGGVALADGGVGVDDPSGFGAAFAVLGDGTRLTVLGGAGVVDDTPGLTVGSVVVHAGDLLAVAELADFSVSVASIGHWGVDGGFVQDGGWYGYGEGGVWAGPGALEALAVGSAEAAAVLGGFTDGPSVSLVAFSVNGHDFFAQGHGFRSDLGGGLTATVFDSSDGGLAHNGRVSPWLFGNAWSVEVSDGAGHYAQAGFDIDPNPTTPFMPVSPDGSGGFGAGGDPGIGALAAGALGGGGGGMPGALSQLDINYVGVGVRLAVTLVGASVLLVAGGYFAFAAIRAALRFTSEALGTRQWMASADRAIEAEADSLGSVSAERAEYIMAQHKRRWEESGTTTF